MTTSSQSPRHDASLFVVAASSQKARGRVRRSVLAGINPTSLRHGIPRGAETFVTDSTDEGEQPLRVWGIRDSSRLRPLWGRVQSSDWLVFFERGFIFAAGEVAATLDSPQLAAGVWPDGATFGLLIGFRRTLPLEVRASAYRSVLGARFLGFRKVNEEWQSAIRRKYGSVESFVLDELLNWR